MNNNIVTSGSIRLLYLVLSIALPNFLLAQFSTPVVVDSMKNALINNLNVLDVDGDQKLDIIVSNLYDSVYWYRNEFPEFRKMTAITNTVNKPVFIDYDDIDNNELNDILVSYNAVFAGIRLYQNLGGGVHWKEIIIDDSIDVVVSRSYFADLDKDGDPDIISCHDLGIAVYIQNAGVFSGAIKVAGGSEFYNLVVHDYNGDGYIDFVTNTAGGIKLYINNHDLTFSSQTLTNEIFVTLESCDIDHDGDFDIFYPKKESSGDIVTYLNDGNDNFTEYQTNYFNAGNIQNPPLKFDLLDADQFTDAVYIPVVSRGIYYKNNDGTGKLNSVSLVDSLYRYTYINIGDLDNDLDNDIAWFANEPFGMKYIGYTTNLLHSAAIDEKEETVIKVYPNPIGERLYLANEQNLPFSMSVNDIMGKVVFTGKNLRNVIDTQGWQSGVFIVRVQSMGRQYIYKIIKK